MKKISLILCLCLFSAIQIFAQDIPNDRFNILETRPCLSDSTQLIEVPEFWSIYQTQNNKWDGPIDSTNCISITVQSGHDYIDFEHINAEKPLFIRCLLDEDNKIPLTSNWLYSYSGFFPIEGNAEMNISTDCENGLCSGLIVGIQVPDETGDSTNLRTYFTSFKEPGGGIEFCLPTETLPDNYIREYILKITLEEGETNNSGLELWGTGITEAYPGKIVGADLYSEYETSDTSYEVNVSDIAYEPGNGSGYIIQYYSPGNYPSISHPFYAEFLPWPNSVEQKNINLTILHWQTLVPQPFTFMRGSLVEGSDSIRHILNVINDGGTFCLYSTTDVVIEDGQNFIYRSGSLDFSGRGSCLMFANGSSLIVDDNAFLKYGEYGIGALAIGRGGQIQLRKNSRLEINNRLVLWDFENKEDDQIHLKLNPGTKLIFGEQATVNRLIHKENGRMKLNVLMNGGILDWQNLSSEMRDLINLIYPDKPPVIEREITLFPNPSSTSFDLSVFVKDDEPMFWVLIDQMGRGVKKGKEALKEGQNVFNIAVHDLPRGIYILQVKIRDEILNKRLMIW